MIWLWILGILLALLILVCWTRVGVRVSFGEAIALDVKVGLLHFRLFPGKKKPKKEKKKKKPKAKIEKPEKKKSAFPKPDFADIKDAAKTLWPPLRRTLVRFGRGICIDPLDLRLTVGGREEPSSAAQLYGELQGAVWTVMPQLEGLIRLPRPHIALGLDFTAAGTQVSGEVGISIRIGTVLAGGFGVAFPGLFWLLRNLRRKKKQPAPEKDSGVKAA